MQYITKNYFFVITTFVTLLFLATVSKIPVSLSMEMLELKIGLGVGAILDT